MPTYTHACDKVFCDCPPSMWQPVIPSTTAVPFPNFPYPYPTHTMPEPELLPYIPVGSSPSGTWSIPTMEDVEVIKQEVDRLRREVQTLRREVKILRKNR